MITADRSSRRRATAIGLLAIVMWAGLALLTDMTGGVPPFQLAAMSFAVGALVGLPWLRTGGGIAGLPHDWRVWLLGIGGLFGYHFLYFTALRNAPAVEASLIAYLWPLLIVVGSALLPGERLGAHHVAGALMGLAGAVVIVTRGGGLSLDPQHAFGHAMAGLCALTWAAYSLLSRRFAAAPTSAVAVFCAATALLSLACHIALETTVWPADGGQWLAVLGLGLLPVGAAFYVWDHGVKRGDIQILGASSYAAPLLSTLALVAAGRATADWRVALACLLIAGGAALAARDMLFARRTLAKAA